MDLKGAQTRTTEYGRVDMHVRRQKGMSLWRAVKVGRILKSMLYFIGRLKLLRVRGDVF